jgi:hypothetical protein
MGYWKDEHKSVKMKRFLVDRWRMDIHRKPRFLVPI